MASILTPSREQNALFANELRGMPLMASASGYTERIKNGIGRNEGRGSKKHHRAENATPSPPRLLITPSFSIYSLLLVRRLKRAQSKCIGQCL